MKAIFSVSILLYAAALLPCSATADEPPVRTAQDVQVVFQSLDRNGDQRISRNEAGKQQSLRKRFAGVDANNDGYLSKQEFEARPRPARFE